MEGISDSPPHRYLILFCILRKIEINIVKLFVKKFEKYYIRRIITYHVITVKTFKDMHAYTFYSVNIHIFIGI